jgi:NADPH-dependent 2,4-dienoyl-CoA reductase/sulfur reductase-like enzyme
MSAAARARRLSGGLEIQVLERGEWVSFGRCGLPYYLEGRVGALEELAVHTPEYFRRERNITVRTGVEVAAIAPARREVVLKGGERIACDRLVVATGARPNGTRLPGAGLEQVFTLHSARDAARLGQFLERRRPGRGVVVGAGYLGLEATEALRTRGVGAVTILEARGDVLGRGDAELTRRVRAHLERLHIELRTGVEVRGIEPERVAGVAAEVVVLAVGFQPDTELAAEAGLELGRSGGIRVSDRMETNLSGVYAAGDCVEVSHLVTGRPVYLPLGTTANKTGRVAGANAAGERERFRGVAGTSILGCCGLGIALTGLSETQARQEGFDPVAVWIEAPDKPRYFGGRLTSVGLVGDRRSGRLLGGAVLGEEGAALRVNVVAAALSRQTLVEEFQHLDLAYSPPFAPVWDPLLIAAQQLVKLIH